MTALFRRLVIDNPLTGRLMVTSLTGPKLGVAFLLVNLTLLGTYIGLFFYFFEEGQVSSDAGSIIFFAQTVVLYGMMCLLLPLKISGFIEGSRLSRAFDQVVVTGASPIRYFAGAWAVGIFFTLVLLIPTVPYIGCAVIFGGVDLRDLALGYGLLLVYSNVMIGVTLALSVFQWEWFAVPMASGLFLLLGVFGLIPDWDWVSGYPIQLAELTPMRMLWRTAMPYEIWHWGGNLSAADVLSIGPVLFFSQIPLSIYPFAAWGTILLVSVAIVVVGAGHQFDQGLNTFGAVVFAGDRRRRMTRSIRNAVSRQVELGFFYENRPKWCAGWEYPIRGAIGVLFVLFVWGTIFGEAYGGMPTRTSPFLHDEYFLVTFILCMLTLACWILAQCEPKFMIYWRARFGRFHLPRELGQATTFLILAGCLFGLLWWNLDGSRIANANENVDYEHDWYSLVPGVFLVTINIYLISRFMSRATQSATFARVSTVLFGVILIAVPPIFIALADNKVIGEPFASLGCATPFVLVHDARIGTEWTHAGRLIRFYVIQGCLAVSMSTFLILFHVARTRLRRMRAARRAAAPPVAALLLAALLVGEARAQEPSPVLKPPIPDLSIIEISRGFDGTVFSRNVDYVTITVRNTGSKTITGELHIEIPGWDFLSDSRTAFEIGPRTTRVLRWNAATSLASRQQTSFNVYSVKFSSGEYETVTENVVVRVLRAQEVVRSKKPRPKQSYVFVGKKERVSRTWLNVALSGSPEFLAACRSRSLPEDAMHYAGVTAVFVGPEDISRWTARQRSALREYARLGGVVMFYGGLDSSGLAGDAVWGNALRVTRSRSIAASEGMLHAIELAGGEPRLPIEVDGESVPLLSARRLGVGWVGHVAFDLSRPALPGGLETTKSFWRRFEDAMPRGSFPFAVGIERRNDQDLYDLSSMLVIGLYFLVYSISYGFILIVFFRRRKRRNLLWATVALVPFAFLLGLPVLNAVLHSKPSRAELRQLTYVARGSDTGLSVAALRIRSSGRQHHEISFAGHDPVVRPIEGRSADFAEQLARAASTLDLRSLDDGEGGTRFGATVSMAPWAERQVIFTDDVPNVDVDGKVTVRGRRADFELETNQIGEGGSFELLLFNFDRRFQSLDVAIDRLSATKYAGRAEMGGGKSPSANAQVIEIGGERYRLSWSVDDDRKRAIVAWIPPLEETFVSSDDLAFEAEVSEYWARRRNYVTVKRNGTTVRLLAHRAVLFELPIVDE